MMIFQHLTVATTRPSILVLWSLKHHRFFLCLQEKEETAFPQQTELQHILLSTFFFNKLVVSQDVLCLLYTFMDGLRTYFRIIDGQNHSPTPNIFHKMQKSLDKIPHNLFSKSAQSAKTFGIFWKKTLTWRLLSVHYASQILASPNTCYAYKRKTKQTNLLRR